MDSYAFDTTITDDGRVVLQDLPFDPGDNVKVTVIKSAPDTEPFLYPDRPKDWKNANPAYWIRVLTERIVERFQPEKVILFGSHARGTASQHSDIDLLVVFNRVDNKRKKAVEIRRALSDSLIAKDIVVAAKKDIDEYGQLVGTVLRPALEEGKVLYEREQKA